MNLEKSIIIQGYRYTQDGNELLQINRFYPNLTLKTSTYQLTSNTLAYSEDDLLYELDYPVQEEKLRSLRRKVDQGFFTLPPGLPNSPSFLALEEEETVYRYAWTSEEQISPEYQKLHDFILRIVTYSTIPSG